MNNTINETFTKHLRLLHQHLKPVLNEGKMNQLSMDLKELSDVEFMKKYKGKTKSQIRSLLKINMNEGGKMNQLSMDLEELSDDEFEKKHGKTKSQMRTLLKVNEGKMNQLSMDLEELSDTEFMKKYKGKTKSQIRALLGIEANRY